MQILQPNCAEQTILWLQVLVITNRLHQVLRPFLLRRTKAVLEATLPRKAEHAIACPQSEYQAAMLKLLRAKGQAAAEAQGSVTGVNNVVMEMRKVWRLLLIIESIYLLLQAHASCACSDESTCVILQIADHKQTPGDSCSQALSTRAMLCLPSYIMSNNHMLRISFRSATTR